MSEPSTNEGRRPEPASTRRYAAFLSYSRADREIAVAVQNGLQRFAKEWHELRALRVFRDDAALAAEADVWRSIERALDQSGHLIVLASPAAAGSASVALEVAYWLRQRSAADIMIAVVDGDIGWNDADGDFDWAATTCLPAPLRGAFANEPLWVDCRELRKDQLSLRAPEFKERIAYLAAPLRNVRKDDLIGLDLDQYRRTRRLVRATITILATLVVLLATATVVAVRQRAATEAQRAAAEEQLKTATARLLTAQAQAATARDPRTAVRLALAAHALRPDPETTSAVLATLTATGYGGTLSANGAGVTTVAVSPDGRTLATGGDDGMVALWNLPGTDQPERLTSFRGGQPNFVFSIAFGPDGTTLAVGGDGHVVALWDVADRDHPRLLGSPLTIDTTSFTGHTDFVSSVAFSPNGRILASGVDDGSAVLWDVTDRSRPRLVATLHGHTDTVRSIAFSPDGRILATGGTDGAAVLWDIGDPAHARRLATASTGPEYAVGAIAFASNIAIMATGHEDGSTVLWNVFDPGHITMINSPLVRRLVPSAGGTEAIRSVAFAPDGRSLAAGTTAGAVLLWRLADIYQPELLEPTMTGPSAVAAIAFRPDGGSLIAGNDDGTAIVWNVREPARPQPTTVGPEIEAPDPLESAAFLSGAVLVTATNGGTGSLWDLQPAAPPVRLDAQLGGGMAVAVAPGRPIVALYSGQGANIWDVADPARPRLVGTLHPAADEHLIALAFAPDGRTAVGGMAVGAFEGRVAVWDVSSAREVGSAPIRVGPDASFASNEWVRSMAYSTDGRTVATTSGRAVRLWNVDDPAQPQPTGPPLDVRAGDAVAFAPDGRTLATTTVDNRVALWDVADPSRPHLVGPPLSVEAPVVSIVALSPDGTVLATAHGNAVILWDIASPTTPRRVGSPLGATGSDITSVAFSPDGRTLAVASSGLLMLFDLGPLGDLRGALIERACGYANGGLDRTEWAMYVPGPDYRDTCPD